MHQLNNVLNRIIKKKNLPKISPYRFRHTRASLLFEIGANVNVVQERLGHASITDNFRYLYSYDPKIEEKHS